MSVPVHTSKVQAPTLSPKVVNPTTAGKVEAVLVDALATFGKLVLPVLGLALANHTAGQHISLSATYQESLVGLAAAASVLWHGVPAALSAKQDAKVQADAENFAKLVASIKAAEAAAPPAV
jgi:hypothetical protein